MSLSAWKMLGHIYQLSFILDVTIERTEILVIAMIIDDDYYRNVWGIGKWRQKRMRDYLLGAVHVWCRDHYEEWFAAKDLIGGPNFYWQETPLYPLYSYYRQFGDSNYAIKQAGRAAGWLLKRVLIEDKKRTYETRKGYTRQYRWVGEEWLG